MRTEPPPLVSSYHSPSSSHSRAPVNSHRWQSKGQQRPGRRKDLLLDRFSATSHGIHLELYQNNNQGHRDITHKSPGLGDCDLSQSDREGESIPSSQVGDGVSRCLGCSQNSLLKLILL